jgi:hypothetical protein
MKHIVTPQNIKSIAKMIEKLAKDKRLVSQNFYPNRKKQDTIFKNIGIKKHIITQSNVSVFNEVVVEVDFMHDRYFIRVHNNYEEDCYSSNTFLAFLINCGDRVEFKNNIVYLRAEHPTDRKCKANEIIKFI